MGANDQLSMVPCVQLGQQPAHVGLGSGVAHVQMLADLEVALAPGTLEEDLDLTLRQSG